jgi:O-antigen/teichoic acid export membrane protein
MQPPDDLKPHASAVAALTDGLPRLSLQMNFSWTFAGNAIYAACQWGMLVLLAKLGSPEMVGQFALGLAITAPVIMFANLDLRSIQATDARGDYRFADYLSLRLIMVLLALFTITGIVLLADYPLDTLLIVLALSLAKGFEAVSDIFYGLLQRHERMDRVAQSKMLKGLLSLVALGIGVYLTGSVLWGALGLAAVWALLLLTYDMRSGSLVLQSGMCQGKKTYQQIYIHAHTATLLKLAWLALPLGLVMLMISLNTNIPRYFVEGFLGERALGIFSALAYLMVAGRMVIEALGQSASPRLATYYAASDSVGFVRLLSKLAGLGLLVGSGAVIVALVAGEPLLALIYQPEYADQNLFIWLMVAAAMFYVASFLGEGMTAARYLRIQTVLFAGVTAATFLACFWLVPQYGMPGAAFALIIAALIELVGSLIIIGHAVTALNRTKDQERREQ